MPRPTLREAGEALYGVHYVRPLADALGVSERTMRYWHDGTREPPPGVWREIASLCRAQGKRLEKMADKLADLG